MAQDNLISIECGAELENAVEIISCVVAFLSLQMSPILAKRVVVIIMLAVGANPKSSTMLSVLSARTIWSMKKELLKGKINEMLQLNYHGNGKPGKLASIGEQIIQEIENGNYYKLQQIVDMVEAKFHIKVSRTAISNLLKKHGIRRLKCGSLPLRADPAVQRQFLDGVLQPLLDKAVEGAAVVLFMDAAHFVICNDYCGYLYGRTRRFIKTFSGRQRYNVLAAVDYCSKEVTTVSNTTYITATEVVEILKKLAVKYKGKTVSIILDNARYQKCKLVAECAKDLGINLVYLPSYSPNLNLIERFWKYVKTELRMKYFGDFNSFIQRIDSIIASSFTSNKAKMETLLSGKFQLYDNMEETPDGISYKASATRKEPTIKAA